VKHATHTQQLDRLRRIEGQVKGLIRMVNDERYCVDILTQFRAVRAALKKVEGAILQQHVEHCVVGAFKGGDREQERAKLDELLTVFGRYTD
jgi:DNA-binding FrmR family transcriptional regulator